MLNQTIFASIQEFYGQENQTLVLDNIVVSLVFFRNVQSGLSNGPIEMDIVVVGGEWAVAISGGGWSVPPCQTLVVY